jgi:hypothetical protein
MTHNPVDVKDNFSTPLQGALTMARRGFRVLPVKPNDKDPFDREKGDDPVLCGGVNISTTDAAKVEGWFKHNPAINYGVNAGGNGLAIVDVDPRKGPDGEWITELIALGPIPDTFRVLTPGGGQHIYFAHPGAGQRKISECIDVRGVGGYVVGPGSVINGRSYLIHTDAPPAACPPDVAAKLGKPGEKAKDNTTPVGELDTTATLARAYGLLAKHAGVDEGNRDNECYRVACRIKDEGVSEPECLDLMLRFDREKVRPPLGDALIRKTVESAYRNSQRPPGSANPANEFPPIGDIGGKPATASPPGPLLERSRDIRREDLAKRRANAMVKGLLHPREQVVMYGESRAGKSFVALDLAYHIAQGRPWAGRKVKRAPVLYVALEGVDGFRERMVAATEAHGEPGDWFARLTVPVSLAKSEEGAAGGAKVIEAAKQLAADCGQGVGLIIVDTYARATAGDNENDTADAMAYAEKRAAEITRQTGAAVMTVMHTNRAGDLRGSLHARNAADVIIRIERSGEGEAVERSAIGEKIKDGQEVALFDFSLRIVPLGDDDDGDPYASAVIVPTAPAARAKKDTVPQARLRKAFEAVADDGAGPVPLAAVGERMQRDYVTGEADKTKANKAKRDAWAAARSTPPADLIIEVDATGTEIIRRKGQRPRNTDPSAEFGNTLADE